MNKDPSEERQQRKCKSHGRNEASSYRGAKRVQVAHQSLNVGDRFMQGGKGKLYELKMPFRNVVFKGQTPVQDTVDGC